MSAPGPASDRFAACMEPVATDLLGKPTTRHGTELRFGTRGSLSVDVERGVWRDHESGEGGGVLALVQRHQRTDSAGAFGWLAERGHVPATDARQTSPGRKPEVEAVYPYLDEAGELLFEVCRMRPKDFRQRRPDGAGGFVWETRGVRRVLYRLPQVLDAVAAEHTIFVVEGEKAVDLLAEHDVTATCSPGGANKWKADFNVTFVGADVVLLPDNDEPGRKHTAAVACALHGIASRVRIVDLPGLPPKGDVFDWIEAGGTREQLEALADQASDQIPAPAEAMPQPAVSATDRADPTEDAVALAFVAKHGRELRFCHHTGAWFRWTGSIWRKQETKLAFTWARQVCRDAARTLPRDDRPRVAKASFAAAIERFAQADESVAVTSEIWDRDPFLLGTPAGTVDLRTALLRPADRLDYITKTTAVAPSVMPDCPRWLDFLAQTTANDAELIRFLRQWCGYSLTGDTREHALLFGFGPGGNGKSVLLNTVAGILGTYARTAAMETFTASQGDRHPTDVAMLHGARLVSASETEEGRAWAETRIKQLTGGDTIAARFMRQDFFEFRPTFKLLVVGNHKPLLRNVDDAARRRFNIVPFLHKPANPDRELETKLRAEWPAILRWMIEGAIDWQKNGLVRPAIVTEATADYFEAQNYFSRWLAECCDLIPTMSMKPSHLLASFNQWCHANGETVSDNRRLRAMLERTPGLRYVTNKGTQLVRGIVVKPDVSPRGGGGGGG